MFSSILKIADMVGLSIISVMIVVGTIGKVKRPQPQKTPKIQRSEDCDCKQELVDDLEDCLKDLNQLEKRLRRVD